MIVRSSCPWLTTTKWDVDVIGPLGPRSVREMSPVQSGFATYEPLRRVRLGIIVPLRLTVVVCEGPPFPSNMITPTSATCPTGPATCKDSSRLICEKTRARLLQLSRFHHLCRFISWESEELDERPHALFLTAARKSLGSCQLGDTMEARPKQFR